MLFQKTHFLRKLKSTQGQGLIEYLIIVSLVAVAAMGIIKVISQNVRVHYTHIAESLGSKADNVRKAEITDSMHRKKDFNNFWEGNE